MSDKYRPDVDGLRAVAILLVVAYHAFPDVVKGGFIGVDVFFVISGFLISGNIFKGLSAGSFTILDFYARRCRRILPALLAVMAAVVVLACVVLSGMAFNRLGRHVLAGATFTSNILLMLESGYFATAAELKPFLHLWSLGIEEQFYLFWPVLALVTYRARMRPLLTISVLMVASFLINLRWASSQPVRDFYLLPSRFWELSIGCALAAISRPLPRWTTLKTVAGLAMLTLAAACLDKSARFPGWWAVLPTAAAALFISAGPDGWWNRRVLAHPAMVSIGLVSYPWYLWHWPLLAIARSVKGAEPAVPVRLAIVTVSLALAYLTRRFVEAPVQRRLSFSAGGYSRRFAVLSSLGLLAGLALVGVLIHTGIFISRDQKNHPLAYQLQRYAIYDNRSTRIGHCFLDTSLTSDEFDKQCYKDAVPGASSMILGDSHAAHLYPGLAAELPGLVQLNASSCPPLIALGEDFAENCRKANQFIFATVDALKPNTVFLDAEWTSYFKRSSFQSLFQETIRNLRQHGVQRIVVIGPLPGWSPSLHQVLEDQYVHAGRELPPFTSAGLDASLFAVNDALRRLTIESGATFISLSDGLCGAQGCRTFVGPNLSGDLLVYDADHLTVAGAKFIVRSVILPALD